MHTPLQQEELRLKLSRKRLTVTVLVVVFLASLFAHAFLRSYREKLLLGYSISTVRWAVFGVGLITTLAIVYLWRCPACNARLRFELRPEECPECEFPLRSKT